MILDVLGIADGLRLGPEPFRLLHEDTITPRQDTVPFLEGRELKITAAVGYGGRRPAAAALAQKRDRGSFHRFAVK